MTWTKAKFACPRRRWFSGLCRELDPQLTWTTRPFPDSLHPGPTYAVEVVLHVGTKSTCRGAEVRWWLRLLARTCDASHRALAVIALTPRPSAAPTQASGGAVSGAAFPGCSTGQTRRVPPDLARRAPRSTPAVAANRTIADHDAQLEQLASAPLGAPRAGSSGTWRRSAPAPRG